MDSIGRKSLKRAHSEDLPSFSEDYQESICDACSKIDFQKIFSKSVKNADGRWEACVGNPSTSSTCPVCRFLAAMIPMLEQPVIGEHRRIYDRWQRKGSAYFLKAFSVDRTFGLAINASSDDLDGVMLTVLPGWLQKLNSSLPEKWKPWKQTQRKPGFISLSGVDSTSYDFHGQRVDESRVNWEAVHAWINFCDQRHGSNCMQRNRRQIVGFKVIDCDSRRIIDAPEDCIYLALSYVWGEESTTTTEFLHQLPDVCPLLFEDAIKVVKHLNLRYLWIDKFCIDQKSETEMHHQILNMDAIYAGSYLTIVAAAGQNPSYGLPGVSTTVRIAQAWVNIEDGLLASSLPDPTHSIKGSKWMTRGWTYQEGILAKRRLIFTDHQVYYQCLGMYCVESLQLPLNRWHTKSMGRFRDQMTFSRLFPATNIAKRPEDFIQRINEYSKRALSYESDALNAVLGVLRAFESAERPIHHLWGIPLFSDENYFLTSDWITSFAVALSWKFDGQATRRPGLPSWSWAGWKGWDKFRVPMTEANYWKKLHNCTWRAEETRGIENLFSPGNLQISIHNRETGSVVALKEDGSNLQVLTKSSPRIYITAATVDIRSTAALSYDCAMPSPWEGWPLYDTWPGHDDPGRENQKAILLGFTNVYPAQAIFLVVKAVQDCYERVNVCTVEIPISKRTEALFSVTGHNEVLVGDVKLPIETLILV